MSQRYQPIELQLPGITYRVFAYTWKTRPQSGVRYDILNGDVVVAVNIDPEHVLGILCALINETLKEVIPNEN